MARIVVKTNLDNDELYCLHCKNKIKIGEKYAIEYTEELGEEIARPLHLDCVEDSDDEDYLSEEEEENYDYPADGNFN